MRASSKIYPKKYIHVEMRRDEPTGTTTFDCHRKSMEDWVEAKNNSFVAVTMRLLVSTSTN
jgi:hypothetical protein